LKTSENVPQNVPFQISNYATGWGGGGRQHRRLPRAANTLAPPLVSPIQLFTITRPLCIILLLFNVYNLAYWLQYYPNKLAYYYFIPSDIPVYITARIRICVYVFLLCFSALPFSLNSAVFCVRLSHLIITFDLIDYCAKQKRSALTYSGIVHIRTVTVCWAIAMAIYEES